MSEKTEQPTPRRKHQARRKGQFPQSKLLSSGMVTLAALIAAAISAGPSFQRMNQLALRAWSGEALSPALLMREALSTLSVCGLPILAAALFAATLVSAGFAGLQLNLDVVKPDVERVNPFAGMKRLLSWKPLARVGKALLAGALVGWVLLAGLCSEKAALVRALQLEGTGAYTVLWRVLGAAVLKAAALLGVLGAGDYLLARRRHLLDLRMTREELKQEHKDSEGDPHSKGKRKSLHRELARGGPARGVQKATAIVVNPTHIAVALRYEPDECEAPYLVAKGREEDAFALRREAQALGIPIVRDIPLARSLIHYDVGEEVPEELYRAAAAVLTVAMGSRDQDLNLRSQTS
ncbi:MAG: EscU/YscU/HrcU family type III secretion system export apparatus switch protein [Myxococcaceae bacterium]